MTQSDTRILILGVEGYLGRMLYHHLARIKGYAVFGIDNGLRNRNVASVGSKSLFEVNPLRETEVLDITNAENLDTALQWEPDVIIHLAEQPSAPFSMRSATDAIETQRNNVLGTLRLLWAIREKCPNVSLVKLGTMGCYGDWIYDHKDLKIPESNQIEVTYCGVPTVIPTPRFPGTLYHFSKYFDSSNIEFACRTWGLRCSDLNQGVVYGTRTSSMREEGVYTRFDYDDYFGTVVNRFITQAVVGIPLTVYGEGGQTRGFIHIEDVFNAIKLVIKNPPKQGEFRIINQLTEVFAVKDIATMVANITGVRLDSIKNPRKEKEKHSYNPEAKKLKGWGLTKPNLMKNELEGMIADVERHKNNIRKEVIIPRTTWNGKWEKS